MKLKNRILLILLQLMVMSHLKATITLPAILSDNMVLQRSVPVNIWGWAKPGESVIVVFDKQRISTKTGADGKWKVTLKPIEAGGPFQLTIKGTNTIQLKNILVGDVWLCSGQSNMEFSLSESRNWEKDKPKEEIINIRLFTVLKNTSTTPLENAKASGWKLCDSSHSATFSAVGFYFAKNLQPNINVPVGLINSSWGGTDIETWTSLETMYKDKDGKMAIDFLKGNDWEKVKLENQKQLKQWTDTTTILDPGIVDKWYLPTTRVDGWKDLVVPQVWEVAGYPDLDGVLWLKKEIILTEEEAKKNAIISLGPVDDCDDTYINGVLVGSTQYQYNVPRIYSIMPGLLKAGKNWIVLKVIDSGGGGGLWGTDSQLYIEVGGQRKNLSGVWQSKISTALSAPSDLASPNKFPSLLYNAMINPLINFAIKGVIWYQGENNTPRVSKYYTQFPNMIADWRTKWNIGNFPFLFVQLANYKNADATPKDSDWPRLREAQSKTLEQPLTGMAVTIDIGDALDIHPKNKDDVGYRLSLAARKVAYQEDIVYSGPAYQSMKIEGNKIILSFNHKGAGLLAVDKYGYLKGFAIAGADKKFEWAKALLMPDQTVVVYSNNINNPVAVRYAWGDNPDDVNFYNKEMLPATPFRTDDW